MACQCRAASHQENSIRLQPGIKPPISGRQTPPLGLPFSLLLRIWDSISAKVARTTFTLILDASIHMETPRKAAFPDCISTIYTGLPIGASYGLLTGGFNPLQRHSHSLPTEWPRPVTTQQAAFSCVSPSVDIGHFAMDAFSGTAAIRSKRELKLPFTSPIAGLLRSPFKRVVVAVPNRRTSLMPDFVCRERSSPDAG